MNITRHTKAALVAALLAAGSLTPFATTVHAATTIHFDAGNVAFGYSDGYWDRGHHWHHWPTTAARNEWRTSNHEHYYSHGHTHDHAAGWRDNDRYWGH